MALAATRLEVHNAIVSMLKAKFASPGFVNRPVHNRARKGHQNTEGQIQKLFNDDNGVLNFITVLYATLGRETAGIPVETVSKTYTFPIIVRRAKNEKDEDDDATASEILFYADLDVIEDLFENTNLGLDRAVTTPGFTVPQPIQPDGLEFSGKLCHTAIGMLAVNVGQCEADEI